MTKKNKYWVITSRITLKETGEIFEYGSEFPNLKDKGKMKILLDRERISLIKPSDIPELEEPEELSVFTPSQPSKESKDKKVGEK